MKNKCAAAIIVSGCLWGFMGIFSRGMNALGVSASGVIFLRCGLSALFFAVTILATKPQQFRVRPRDIWCFVGSGICSLLFFSYCYFTAMTLMSLSAAVIMLYIAPSIVTVLSVFFFKEKFTGRKLLALVLSFAGCALVSGLGGDMGLSAVGVLYGLGAGFGYALYSIFARFALERGYASNTVNFYSCLLAAIGSAVIWGVSEPVGIMFSSWSAFGFCLAAAVVTCYLPYLLYTYGLTGVETGKASIMASVELVVATFIGVTVYHESLTFFSVAGVALVLSAVVILNVRSKQRV